MIGLVDADILTYQIGYGADGDTEQRAINTLDGTICDLMLFHLPDVFEFEYFITGKDPKQPNFREDIAVTQPYKGNRKGNTKPQHLDALRNRLVDYWGADVAHGEEADDRISKRMTQLGTDGCICISIDKDLDTVDGWHYNFRKNKRYYVTKEGAIYNFYTQLLMGDRVDNIKGAAGIGEKKAAKILDKCISEHDMWDACVEAHGSRSRALEDARLLHMRRKDDELWLPPDERL